MSTLKVAGITIIVLLSLSFAFFDYNMLQKAAQESSDSSIAMGAFTESSAWLSKMLKPNEVAIVPTSFVFSVLNPDLTNRLIDCQSIWDSAGIEFHERTSPEKLKVLQSWFNQFLKNNPQVKYIIRDWVDEYDKYLFLGNMELISLIKEVKVSPFTLSNGWSNKITIYEQIRYEVFLDENFSSPPTQFHVHPSNVNVSFGNNGCKIVKNLPQAGFYIQLLKSINCSKNNYLLLNTTFNLENSTLTIVFYYDNNRDGIFSGYESTDYVKSDVFSQIVQKYVKGQTYLIYQTIPTAIDPVVQIGIIVTGDRNGSISIHRMTVFSETS